MGILKEIKDHINITRHTIKFNHY